MMRKLTAAIVCLGLSYGVSGCHKKPRTLVLPQAQAPVVLEPLPDSMSEVMVEAPPVDDTPAPTAAAAARPRRERRRPQGPKSAAVPSAQVPGTAETVDEEEAIGDLTAGGDASSQRHQEAVDLIASNEKQLSVLPAGTLKDKRIQINKIRNFQRQAQEALKSGDAEGAKTLATKAQLLLFDLNRSGGE
jgi:hypothetical protein